MKKSLSVEMISAYFKGSRPSTVLIASPRWRLFGGSYYVGYETAKVFMKSGYQVYLTGIGAPSKDRLVEIHGSELNGLKMSVLPIDLSKISLAIPLFSFILAKLIKRIRPNMLWIDKDLYSRRDAKNLKIVEYMHGLSEAVTGELHPKYEKGIWKLYGTAYLRFYQRMARRNPFYEADKVLTNSKYTASLVKKIWGELPEVLYPPVDVSYFKSNVRSERSGVILFSRIAWDKHIEDVIIACSEVNTDLKIMGGIADLDYYWVLRRIAERLGVKIQWVVNVRREVLRRELSKAKVFVSTGRKETFGIVVAEAMAAGLPTIVYRSGAPYSDIIEYDKYGLSYETVDELKENLERLLSDENEWQRYNRLSLQRVKIYDRAIFEKNMLRIIRELET